MKRDQLIRALRKEAREAGLSFLVDTRKGKGSHYRIKVGDRAATIQSGELSPKMVRTIRKQLGLD